MNDDLNAQIDHCSFSNMTVHLLHQDSTAQLNFLFVLAGPFQVGASTKKLDPLAPKEEKKIRSLFV